MDSDKSTARMLEMLAKSARKDYERRRERHVHEIAKAKEQGARSLLGAKGCSRDPIELGRPAAASRGPRY